MTDREAAAGAPGERASAPSTPSPTRPPATSGLAALLVCLGLVALAEVLLVREVAERDQGRFDRAVGSIEQRILARFGTCDALLRGGAGLFAATRGELDAAGFRRFATRTRLQEMHPELLGIGFSLLVPPERVASLPAELERQGLPRVELRPEGDGERHAIVYLEPLDHMNLRALGFDMHSEPVRRAAMDRARDTAWPALTGRVKLVQEIDAIAQPGFLLYVPIYRGGEVPESVEERRAALHGFVYAPIRAHDFFHRLFEGADLTVDFAVHDGDDTSAGSLLFGPAELRGSREAVRRLEVSGRAWTIRYAANARFDAAGSRFDVLLLGVVGALASLGVLVLVRRQAAARHAEADARRSEEKRRVQAEALAAELVALSNDFVQELERRRGDEGDAPTSSSATAPDAEGGREPDT
jgi:CHASE1-domain containing sensor protein